MSAFQRQRMVTDGDREVKVDGRADVNLTSPGTLRYAGVHVGWYQERLVDLRCFTLHTKWFSPTNQADEILFGTKPFRCRFPELAAKIYLPVFTATCTR